MNDVNTSSMRRWLIRWMYAAAIAHLLAGVLLPWIGNMVIFDGYHRSIESAFWGEVAPAAARAQQVWWMALFGATVQSLALYMWALIRIADQNRSAAAWGWLITGIVIWAPQDMLISLRAGAWSHVWIDCFALVTMLPPLVSLYRYDSKAVAAEAALRGSRHE